MSARFGPGFRSTQSIALGLPLLVTLLGPAAAGPASAAPPLLQPSAWGENVPGYLDLIRLYRRDSDRDRAIARLLDWDRRSVRRVMGGADPGLRSVPLDLQAATLLHGDAAILAYERGDASLGEFHLEWGLRLLSRASDDSTAVHWPQRWLLAIGLFHASSGALSDASAFLEEALDLLPDAPQLLLVLGQIEESLATRQFRGWAPRKKSEDRRRDGREKAREGSTDQSLLRDAEAHYLRALAADPGLREARLHLGRVQQAQGKTREARESLEQVLAAQPGTYVEYVANLLLGGLHEADGDLTRAAAHYRAAVTTDPRNQVAVLALAHATHRMGERHESAAIAERLLSRREDLALHPDGWWVFRMGPLGDSYRAAQILDELREEVTE